MKFSKEEKQKLLSLKGVGQTVVQRLEEIGIYSFEEIQKYEPIEILEMVSEHLNSTCWKNSPNAKNAINSICNLAKN